MIAPITSELEAQFQAVTETLAAPLMRSEPKIVSLVAKWARIDLVPGLSDMDFRVICRDDTAVEDWVRIDRLVGETHLEMVQAHPEWNRINEHTPGAGMTVSEVMDQRLHRPEYATWTLWIGEADWYEASRQRLNERTFNASDELYHFKCFLDYYSPYIKGIDPPINLGPFEHKYALHSRCWHYFAPPILAAACILARRNFCGKTEGLTWLKNQGIIAGPVSAVLEQVAAQYQTPELTDHGRLEALERLLFSGFQAIHRPVCRAVRDIGIDADAAPLQQKVQVAALPKDPLLTVFEAVRFSRIRAGRYYFYLNAPAHFDANRQIRGELMWLKKLVVPVVSSLQAFLGQKETGLEECVRAIGLRLTRSEREAIGFVVDLAQDPSGPGPDLRASFSRAMELFHDYYRVLERVLDLLVAEADGPVTRTDRQNPSRVLPAASAALAQESRLTPRAQVNTSKSTPR